MVYPIKCLGCIEKTKATKFTISITVIDYGLCTIGGLTMSNIDTFIKVIATK